MRNYYETVYCMDQPHRLPRFSLCIELRRRLVLQTISSSVLDKTIGHKTNIDQTYPKIMYCGWACTCLYHLVFFIAKDQDWLPKGAVQISPACKHCKLQQLWEWDFTKSRLLRHLRDCLRLSGGLRDSEWAPLGVGCGVLEKRWVAEQNVTNLKA